MKSEFWKIIDSKYFKEKKKYFFQTILSTFCIFIVLLFMDFIDEAAVVSSFGATAFIVFALPHSQASSFKKVIGGYSVGILVGFIFASLCSLIPDVDMVVFLALGIGISFFIMVLFDVEHPPAVGMTLGLILDGFNHKTVVIVFSGIALLLFLKTVLKKYMINLV